MQHNIAISELIGDIYECAIFPSHWNNTIEKVCHHFESAAATFSVLDLKQQKEQTLVNYGISDQYNTLYREKYHCTDLFLHPLLLREVGEPVLSGDLVPDAELLNSRIYREWAAPQGFRDTIMTMLSRNQGQMAFFGLTRLLSQRRYDEADRQAVRLLAPHLQRAVLISDLMEQQSVEKDRFAEVIDSIATPTLIVTQDRRIVHANAAGRGMIERGRPVVSVDGVLMLPPSVRAALTPRSGVGGTPLAPETIRIEDPEGHRESIIVVMPLGATRRKHRPGLSQFAVFIQEANQVAPLASDVWARLFALTGGELRVLQGLIEGLAPGEIAELYGIARSTVKTHLLSLFRKTGTKRQAELVKLALSAIPQVRTG